jgi:circadian clock protein KaiB
MGNEISAGTTYKFMLFISGMSVKSVKAIDNFKKICDKYLDNNFELQIIDITKEKEKAVSYQIFAVPALIRLEHLPMRTILGDLSETEKVLKILDLQEGVRSKKS